MQTGQNARGEYRVGPGASSLLLIFVAVCLTTVGILTLISAIADSRMGDRSLEHINGYYDATTRVQREIGVLDGQLASARKQAAGDVETYRELVQSLAGDQVPMKVEADGDDAMQISFDIDMNESNIIQVALRAPLTFEGPRYELVRHVAVNTAAWQPEEDMNLFGFGLEEVESAQPMFDDDGPGFVGEGEMIEQAQPMFDDD